MKKNKENQKRKTVATSTDLFCQDNVLTSMIMSISMSWVPLEPLWIQYRMMQLQNSNSSTCSPMMTIYHPMSILRWSKSTIKVFIVWLLMISFFSLSFRFVFSLRINCFNCGYCWKFTLFYFGSMWYHDTLEKLDDVFVWRRLMTKTIDFDGTIIHLFDSFSLIDSGKWASRRCRSLIDDKINDRMKNKESVYVIVQLIIDDRLIDRGGENERKRDNERERKR